MPQFNSRQAQQIARTVKKSQREIAPYEGQSRSPLSTMIPTRVAKTGEEGIPERDGLKLGKGEVTLWHIEDLDAPEKSIGISKDGNGEEEKLTAYNLARSEIEKNTMVVIQWVAGIWMIIVEICDGSEDDEGEPEDEP